MVKPLLKNSFNLEFTHSESDGNLKADNTVLILMPSEIVYCAKCSKGLQPSQAYRIFLDDVVELPWSTPQHRQYKGGNNVYLCSKKCYEEYKLNMKEFWNPEGEY